MGLMKDCDGLFDGIESPAEESMGPKLIEPDVVVFHTRTLQ